MLHTRRFRDQVAQVDCGMGAASFATSGNSSGPLINAALYQKMAFRVVTAGTQYANVTLALYSTSNSFSSWSSASSNWAPIDSTNCAVTLSSAAASVSSNTYQAVLDTRGDKFPGIQYIRPVISVSSGVSSSSVARLVVLCDAYVTGYGPASGYDSPSMVTTEVDYL